MKFECIRENLVKVLGKAERIAIKNPTLPILQCVLLVVKDGVLTIKSTNLSLGLEVTIPVKVIKEGLCAVPASALYAYLSGIKSDSSLVCEFKDNLFRVVGSRGSTSFKVFPAEDFPLIPTISKKDYFQADTNDIVTGLKSVVWSSSSTSIKPELSSVFINPADSKVCFVATDSFRLAEKVIFVKTPKNLPSFLLPAKNVTDLIRILDGETGKLNFFVSSNQAAVVFGNVYVFSRTTEGAFPDYGRIMPKEFTSEATVLKEDLLNALRLTNIFSDKWGQLQFALEPNKKRLLVGAKNSELGEVVEEVPASITGSPISISFNQRYVSDCLSSINRDSVSLSFTGEEKPLRVGGVGDSSFNYIVMPMNK